MNPRSQEERADWQSTYLDLDNEAVCLEAEKMAGAAARANFVVLFSRDSAKLAYDVRPDQARQILKEKAQPGQVRWM